MRLRRIDRLKVVQRECEAVRMALEHYGHAVATATVQLPRELRPKDLKVATARLEATYVIRMFAEFENQLRHWWTRQVRPTGPPTEMLIARTVVRQDIPNDVLGPVQDVRSYRNALVHDDAETVDEVTLDSARKVLCRYLGCL